MFKLEKNTENEPALKAFLRQYEGESIIQKFMSDPDESDSCLPHADIVEEFCGYMNGRDILSEFKEQVALLDNRAFYEGGSRSEPSHGRLTARQLYEELKKPVSPRHPSGGLKLFPRGYQT